MSGFIRNQIFSELYVTTLLVRRHFDRRATRLGLTRVQWRALKMISRAEGLSQTELAEQLDVEPIQIGRVVDRLQKSGFVERRADPNDRRRWRLFLTAKANAVVDEMNLIAEGLVDDALLGVEQADLDALDRVLTRLRANLAACESAAAENGKERS